MRRAALLAGFAALLLATPAFAEEGWGYELSGNLMSPYCPGRALSECPSPKAGELRAWIVDQEKAGRSREEVEAQLYERFGEELRQAPKAEGVGLVSYAVPIVLFAAGGLLVGVFLRRNRSSRIQGESLATSQASPPAPDEDLERMLDEELRE
ncbi:MAG: cytochrome c-type biogenesis protein CcmH [Deltaproteobacteria bacterium]|nr:cytochrome c-type biogenesis protein CcmH [Deltaproteobacteria bacterium]MBW2393637.1 cytochrome c-type biogenesis protein CcmH [Deltaproteobacteria bacterium]